jgi:hypothetical protein
MIANEGGENHSLLPMTWSFATPEGENRKKKNCSQMQ